MNLKEIYQKFEGFQCLGKCKDSCGPVVISTEEEAIIGPMEWDDSLTCNHLSTLGTCSIYENRPFLCRAFGAIDTPLLKCPFGCKPILTAAEGRELTAKHFRGGVR